MTSGVPVRRPYLPSDQSHAQGSILAGALGPFTSSVPHDARVRIVAQLVGGGCRNLDLGRAGYLSSIVARGDGRRTVPYSHRSRVFTIRVAKSERPMIARKPRTQSRRSLQTHNPSSERTHHQAFMDRAPNSLAIIELCVCQGNVSPTGKKRAAERAKRSALDVRRWSNLSWLGDRILRVFHAAVPGGAVP